MSTLNVEKAKGIRVKFVIVGDKEVGKTTLASNFTKETPHSNTSFGIETYKAKYIKNDEIFVLQFLHFALSIILESRGISSVALSFLVQLGQRLRLNTKSSPIGMRVIKTVVNEPRHIPKIKNISNIKLLQIYGEWI
jgi:GTPase SAR1 family protein